MDDLFDPSEFEDTPPEFHGKYELRDYQKSAKIAAINQAKYCDGHFYVTIPTGGGKSLVIAALAEELDGRILVLAHRKELLKQNSEEFTEEVSIYSAGLGEKDHSKRITVAGIQSIINVAEEHLQDIKWLLVDECHHLNNDEEGMYWDLVNSIPDVRICGFTATPFRLDNGKLSWGKEVFTIPYEPLIKKKYLAPLINKVPFIPVIMADIRLGDYVLSQLEDEMIDPELLVRSVERIRHYSVGRHSVLIFVTTLKHGYLLQQVMVDNGMYAQMVDGKTPADERDQLIEEFKGGSYQYLINCMVLTEGFNYPGIDMLVVLRPTKSKALHEQILGRGVRMCEGKDNCLVLDMAGNLSEHGGLGSPFNSDIKKKAEEQKGKICPVCETYTMPVTAIECADCGFLFPLPEVRKVEHSREHDSESDPIYQGDKPSVYNIRHVLYFEHMSKAGNLGLRVDYLHEDYGNKTSEYIHTHHPNEWLRGKAWDFFSKRGVSLPNQIETYSTAELIEFAQRLKKPMSITVRPQKSNPKYTEVSGYSWEEKTAPVMIELDDSIPF